MKKFEFRRHSIKDGPTSAMIGPKGYDLAREVGRQQLRGRGFTHFFASAYFRTHQTLAAFAEGAGDFRLKYTPEMPPIYVSSPKIEEMWRVCAAAEKRGEDMFQAAWMYDPFLFDATGEEMLRLFVAWQKSSFPDEANVLIVGHSPGLEFLLSALINGNVSGFKPCQGFRLTVEGPTRTVDLALT